MRTRLTVLAAALVAAVAAAAGWNTLALGPLHRIVVSDVVWHGSGAWQIVIDDRDRYIYRHGADTTTGRIAFAPLARRLAAVAELRFLPPASTGSYTGDGVDFWVEGRRTVSPFIAANGGGHAALRSFAAALHAAVAADARRQDAPRIGALTSLRDLLRVEAVSNGCFGPCGLYEIVLRRDGSGEIDWHADQTVMQSRTRTVAWSRVTRALHDAHVERLDGAYPARAIDTWSATLRFVFPHVTYTVKAPDSTTWPPEFVAAFARLRHLARETAWSPPLGEGQVRTLAR